MKAVLIGKLFSPVEKLERSYTSILTEYLKAIEQKEAKTDKRSRSRKKLNRGSKSTKQK